jgi:excinuclease ABC subunit A
LAPVARTRKGSFEDECASLQAQGFVRVRVDGEMVDLDSMPELNKNEKHDIDVVIDRLRIKPESKQRLAESFETALTLAQGRVIALDMDTNQEHLFSSRYACPVCSHSLPELEPRLFSFNNPVGACASCDGLGHVGFFDPKRVVAFPELSLGSGAIRGWDKRNAFTFSMLSRLATHYDFDIETTWESLPEEIRQIVLYGSGEVELPFFYLNEKGRSSVKRHAFEGVIPNLERRWKAWVGGGAISSEMESATLFIVAATLRARAGGIMVCIGSPSMTHEESTASMKGFSIDPVIDTAVHGLRLLIARDRAAGA